MSERATPSEGSADEPVVCTITDETKAEREEFLRSKLAPYVETVEKREPRGWRLRVAPDGDAVEGLTTFVRREHECCSFADFELHVTPGDDPNVLEIYGPEGTDEMFRGEFVDRLVEEFDAELVA